ncbi:MAG TPA: hypothetical protein VHS31_08020, partial [Tepidisphaeraceae bacterium]|nr:hypothetical protein [Tepidisphaeraceae bacterium]
MGYRVLSFFAILSMILFITSLLVWWHIHHTTLKYARQTSSTPSIDVTDDTYLCVQTMAQSVVFEHVSSHLDFQHPLASHVGALDDHLKATNRYIFQG